MPDKIFPDSFFNLPHPSSPFVSIQLRTNIEPDKDIDDISQWQEITFNPNNFFNSLTLEDNGGVYRVKLNLYDKNYSFIENAVVQSILKTRLANKLIKNPQHTANQDFFQFFIARSTSINMRIRFGYSEFTNDDEKYISTNSFSSQDWVTRAKEEKTVLKTPWIYLQMLQSDFRVTEKGLELEIEAFSVMNSFLEKAKLVETYSRFFGEPKEVISYICNKVIEAAEKEGEKVSFEYIGEKEPVGYPSQETGKEIIEIMLGGQPTVLEDGSIAARYKSLGRILNEICEAVRPLKYDREGNEIPFTADSAEEAEDANEESERAAQVFKYSFFIEELEDETKILFYYQDPLDSIKKQTKIRTYSWIQNGKSIVKNLDIKTETDFAMLSLPVVNINESTGEITARTLRGSERQQDEEDQFDLSIGNTRNLSGIFEGENFSSVFAAEVVNSETVDISNDLYSSETQATKISDLIAANLNQQVMRGTLTLFGDPFYLFDKSIKRFSYVIHIIINRPNFVDPDGNFVPGGRSFLSGYYAVGKITHNIGMSGFETQLEVIKINSLGN